ncbi:MAG: PorT family protein [Sphingobacteriales bacterium]|nr:PorT family protein [Sphingobacteriales bacterium]
MRKILFLFFVIIAFVQSVSAQIEGFRFGLHIDPNVAWFRANVDGIETSSKMGFGYGLMIDYFFADRYAISTGMNHMFVGGSSKVDSLAEYKVNLQYIEFPALLKFRTNEMGNNLTFFGQMGLTPGIKVSSKEDKVKSKDYKPINLSLSLGGGAEYAIDESISLFAALFFDNGFTGVVKNVPNDGKISQSKIGLRLGVLF